MILLQSGSKYLLQILQSNAEKKVDIDCQTFEFDDVRYHVQFSVKRPQFMFISLSIPAQAQDAAYFGALPLGAVEAVKAIYGSVVQMLDPPKDGYDLTLKLNLPKLPSDEEQKLALFEKIASVREVVLGAPLRVILKHLALKTVAPNINKVMTLVYRPRELFFILPQTDKVTIVYPMRFKDPIDIILGTSFLQEFVEARCSTGFTNAPSCSWSNFPPPELEAAPSQALDANAGFFTFVIYPRHIEGSKLDKTVWNLLTFHAYVSYHVKFSGCFMHTRMRRRVESLIQALDQTKADLETSKKL